MRLLTFVEVADPVADPRRLSVSARHEAVLSNGRRVLLLTARAWLAMQAAHDLAAERAAGIPKVQPLQPVA